MSVIEYTSVRIQDKFVVLIMKYFMRQIVGVLFTSFGKGVLI